jgi:hypothetical protein
MWYNGTSLSEKARRAMENEKVTIVSHITGYIHTLYSEATIDRASYDFFSVKLREFLAAELTSVIFINFLRFKSKYKSLFQYRCDYSGKDRFISLEKMFEYEHSSKFNISPDSRDSLVKEIEEDEFHLSPIVGKVMLNDIESILSAHTGQTLKEFEQEFFIVAVIIPEQTIHEMFKDLRDFVITDPQIPDINKTYIDTGRLEITNEDNREKIIHSVLKHSGKSELSLLSLFVYRQLDKIDWHPFIKAAIERNPVCFSDLDKKSTSEVYAILSEMPDESIYDTKRMALPDEVWNFRRGDGIEKAILLADFIVHKDNSMTVSIEIDDKKVLLTNGKESFQFTSHKNFRKIIKITGSEYVIN